MSRCPLCPDSHTTHEVDSLRMNKHEMQQTLGMKRMITSGKRRLHSLLISWLISSLILVLIRHRRGRSDWTFGFQLIFKNKFIDKSIKNWKFFLYLIYPEVGKSYFSMKYNWNKTFHIIASLGFRAIDNFIMILENFFINGNFWKWHIYCMN